MRKAGRPFQSVLALVALSPLGLACEKNPPGPPEPSERPAPSLSATQSGSELAERLGDAAPKSVAPSASALAVLRERSLQIPPRAMPAQSISFGRGRLAQLRDSELVVRELSSFAIVARFPIKKGRGVLELADGALLAASADGLQRLLPDAKTSERFPVVTLLPGSQLVADRRERDRLWVLQVLSPTLYRYDLSPSTLPLLAPSEFFELGEPRPEAFVSLKDGSFLYGSRSQLRRMFAGGKQVRIELPPRDPRIFRLLLTRRIDQVWVVFRDGRADLLQIAPGHQLVRSLELGATVFDLAANDTQIGMIRVEQTGAGPRSFSLSVIDDRGKETLTAALPSEPAPGIGDDWVNAVTRNKTIAMSTNPPLVAVGGPSFLAVWNLKTGQQNILQP